MPRPWPLWARAGHTLWRGMTPVISCPWTDERVILSSPSVGDEVEHTEKIAIYGKGGVGKSMIATSLSIHYAQRGHRVLHVGCDPKCDSAWRLLEDGASLTTVLSVIGDDPEPDATASVISRGRHGIHCCESGGPAPGLGCGGRAVARTIEFMDEAGILASDQYDVAMFDVLGDVVCGGFAAPLRRGFARKVVIVVSEEPMALFAANAISRAIHTYQRNGVVLSGLVANLRSNDARIETLEEFARALGTEILAVVQRDARILTAERAQRTVLEHAPESEPSQTLRALGDRLLERAADTVPPPTPMNEADFFQFVRTHDG